MADDPAPRGPDHTPERDRRTGKSAAAARMSQQASWVDQQVRRAMERGEFDDLPGHGKPIEGLGHEHDPDWWLRSLVEREQVTGVLPPALMLRTEDAELDAALDRLPVEREVRRELEDFNDRVRRARMQLLGGPPVITPERDVDAEVDAWRARRDARAAAQRARLAETPVPEAKPRGRWRRRS